MAVYAIYSYEFQEGNRSLLYKDTQIKTIDMANKILGDLIHDGVTIVGKKRKQDQPLKNLNMRERQGVFSWVLCNVKELATYEGHDKLTVESHPGSYVIIDNRPDVCQIAVEKNGAFDSDTDKVIKYIKRTLNQVLLDYGLKIVIKQKYQAGKFKEIIQERITRYNDSVKKVVWEFPNPDRIKGIDAGQQMKDRLEGLKLLAQATHALKGKLTLTGSKGNPLNVDEETIEDLAQIIALSAQNNYRLSYHFYKTSTVSYKDVVGAFCTIENRVILDFENNQTYDNGNGLTYELITRLDDIRKQIADYDHEKIFNEGE